MEWVDYIFVSNSKFYVRGFNVYMGYTLILGIIYMNNNNSYAM